MSDKYQARKTESVGLTQPNATSPTWQWKLERFHLKSGRDLSAIKPAIGDDQYQRMVQVLHDPWQAGN
ncbi:hypothetical protein [Mesorhizobium sp. CA16]|uniref:hypothetical protein n=1 Tax=Mesorhizobium sp. CA16 TaxID=588496 RepID=UPI001CC9DBC1|nr:hypothetical protein [Mesorhizobium sp. CA16]MBZ9913250.1 hypothetical protein [Mesorhizobium sp. CA16]